MFDKELYGKIKQNWDNLAKPIDGLGEFEDVLSRIGACQKNEEIDLENIALLIFIADNGIVEEGVSQSSYEVTYEVAKALGNGSSTVCHMARTAGMKVVPVNVGIKQKGDIPGVENRCVRNCTADFLKEPAMTPEDVKAAMDIGREYVRKLTSEGITVIALGEMGIGNTTTSAAVIAGMKNLSGRQVCSRGAGLSDSGLIHKINVVDEAINRYNLHSLNPLEILTLVGGLDVAALTGAILEAARLNVAVISDGFITGTAALIAKSIETDSCECVIFSHSGREHGMEYILSDFDARPVISADMALGEGTGTCIFVSAAKCALSVYHGNTQFNDINIDNYKRFS